MLFKIEVKYDCFRISLNNICFDIILIVKCIINDLFINFII